MDRMYYGNVGKMILLAIRTFIIAEAAIILIGLVMMFFGIDIPNIISDELVLGCSMVIAVLVAIKKFKVISISNNELKIWRLFRRERTIELYRKLGSVHIYGHQLFGDTVYNTYVLRLIAGGDETTDVYLQYFTWKQIIQIKEALVQSGVRLIG